MALKMDQCIYMCAVLVHMYILLSYICTDEIHVYAHYVYLHIGNQACSAYTFFIYTPKATHVCPQETSINPSAKGPARSLLAIALEMGYFWEKCRIEPRGRPQPGKYADDGA